MARVYPILYCIFLFTTTSILAQLPDGVIAPNWTLDDIEGNSHTLYDYLDQGKTVVIDFSATWCGPCWNYHMTGAIEGFYEDHGPDGDNTGMAFFIEADLSTGMDDLLGLTPSSQGNWVATTIYPIIDVQTSTVPSEYQITYYPTIYEICPDYQIYEVGQVPTQTLSNWIQSCSLSAEVDAITNTQCYGLGQGMVELAVTGGYGSITYNWSNGQNTQNLMNVEAGIFDVTVTEGQGKFEVLEDILVDGPAFPIEVESYEIDDVLCNGDGNGSVIIAVTGGNGGFSYSWSNGGNGPVITNLDGGTYVVTVLDANNCDFVEEYEVYEPDVLELEYMATDEYCDQGNAVIEMNALGGTAPYTYEADGGIQVGNNPLITNLTAGVYSISVTDANDCLTEHVVEIINIPEPEITMPFNPFLDCQTSQVQLDPFIEYSGNPDLFYDWVTDDGNIVSGQNDLYCIVDQPGTYTLYVNDYDNGCGAEASVAVMPNPDIPQVEAGDDEAIDCDNLVINLSAQLPDPPENYSVSWTTEDGNILSGANTLTPEVDAAGTYSVVITDTDNGCSASDNVLVVDNTIEPEAQYVFQSEELLVQFTNQSVGSGNTYLWDFGDGQTSTVENPVHVYSSSGDYQVCLVATNGCGNSTICNPVNVEGTGSVLTVLYDVKHITCQGDADGAINITVAGGSGNYTFAWSYPDGSTNTVEDISNLAPGTYEVVIDDGAGNTHTVTITVEEPALLEAVANVQNADCADPMSGAVALTASGGVPGYTYLWNNGQQTADLTGLSAGVYTCTVVDQNGCAVEISVTVDEDNDLEGDFASEDVLCFGDATGYAEVMVDGGVEPYTYLWSNNATTPSVDGLESGLYTCEVTDQMGCITILEIVIDQPDEIEHLVETSYNGKTGLITVDLSVHGGTPGYAYLWNNGYTGEDLFNVPSGTYQCTITDENGCEMITDPVRVMNPKNAQDPIPEIHISIEGSPANQPFVVWIDKEDHQEVQLFLYNVAGQLIDVRSGTDSSYRLDLTNQGAGMYFLSIMGDQSWVRTERIVVAE